MGFSFATVFAFKLLWGLVLLQFLLLKFYGI